MCVTSPKLYRSLRGRRPSDTSRGGCPPDPAAGHAGHITGQSVESADLVPHYFVDVLDELLQELECIQSDFHRRLHAVLPAPPQYPPAQRGADAGTMTRPRPPAHSPGASYKAGERLGQTRHV